MVKKMKKIVVKEYKLIPVEVIRFGKYNARKTRHKVGIEELKISIDKFNLIEPIVVTEEKKGEYKIIAGQRRYIAFVEMKIKQIPAIVIEKLDDITETLVSFSENIHRYKLPYEDTINVCDKLFKIYTGTKYKRIEKMSKDLGIPINIIKKYIAARLIPDEVRSMVDEGRLSHERAYKVTSVFWPNEKKIIEIAEYISEMTGPEWERALDYGKKKPNAPIQEIIREAKRPPKTIEVIINLPNESVEILGKIAKNRKMNVNDLIKELIDGFIQEEV